MFGDIIRNAAQCGRCNEVVESKHRHDCRACDCGDLIVDGGRDYLKRMGYALERAPGYTELSVHEGEAVDE